MTFFRDDLFRTLSLPFYDASIMASASRLAKFLPLESGFAPLAV
jgi:hypothetical protein